jgi:predicted ATPase
MNNLILNNIHVQFFKSIGSATIEIPELAVFVGKNAAGKSNIVSVFRFLRDLADKGFQTAVQQQGGLNLIFNALASEIESIQIKVRFEIPNLYFLLGIKNIPGIAFGIEHRIIISKENRDLSSTEMFIIDAILHPIKSDKKNKSTSVNLLKDIVNDEWKLGQIVVNANREGLLTYSHLHSLQSPQIDLNVPFDRIRTKHVYLRDVEVKKKSLLDIELFFGEDLRQFYSSIGIFDFIPKSIKSAVHTAGNATLDEDGGNINIILQHILQDEEKRHSFMNLVRYVLPFVKDVEIDIPRNGLAMPVIREAYSERFRLPAEFFSDGTATVIAIIVALFFEENSVVVIEEPERYVHPAIMDKLATLFEDAARSKKVVVTTHSPELIRHLKPEHVQLVSRDSNHFTQIRRVTDDEEMKSFLDSDMQLDDLLVNNFFED